MPEKATDIPFSTEAEQCVLGALMLENDRWDDVNLLLKKEDFFISGHRAIYMAMSTLSAAAQPFDLITLSEKLERSNDLERCGGFAYLAELSKNTPSAANIMGYAAVLVEKSRLRELLVVGNAILADVHHHRLSAPEVAEHAENALFKLSEQGIIQHAKEIEVTEALDLLLSKLESATGSDNFITGTPTGMAALDYMSCGLQPGDLILLAARPSMGKTSMALSWCIGALLGRPKKSVFIFSIEMPTEQLMMRLLSMRSKVELSRLRSGDLGDTEWNLISKQRQGPTGTLKVQFDGKYTLFSEYPEGSYDLGYDDRKQYR